MSKTFTSRPGVTNARGRGRGTQSRQIQAVNANRLGEPTRETGARPRVAQPRTLSQSHQAIGRDRMAEMSEQRETEEETVQNADRTEAGDRRMTYQGGYSMIAPNQRKRQEINAEENIKFLELLFQVAQREAAAYQAHKQQNTPKSFSYVGTAGGGQTQAEARRKLVLESPSKTQKLLQKQERKSYFKQKEEEEIQKKKEEQRRKAEMNEKRKKEEEAAAEHKWDQQKKLTNEAFLRRMENKNKRLAGAQASSSTQPTQSASASESVERQQLPRAVRTSAPLQTHQYSEPDEVLGSVEHQRVSQLAAIFPQYSQSELLEILKQVDFSLDSAVAILQD